MREFDEAWAKADPVEGWMTREQGLMLFRAARAVHAGSTIVEIGSHHGKSAIIIASAMPKGSKLVAVDPFDDVRWGGGATSFDAFTANLKRAGVEKSVEVRRGYSGDVGSSWLATERAAMVYIDGAHDYATVRQDIILFGAILSAGGRLLIHDSFSSVGVTRALLRHVLRDRNFRFLGAAQSLAEFSKQPATVRSRLSMVWRLWYFARNIGIKLAQRRGWTWPQRALRHNHPGSPF